MDARRHTLPNGLTTILAPTPFGHAVNASIFVRVGSAYETAATAGMSHFVEHLLFQGNAKFRDSAELCAFVEERGGEVNAQTTPDFTQALVSLHRDFAVEGLEVLAALVFGAAVDRWDLERELRIILNEQATNGPDPEAEIRDWLWPGHPLGRDVSGDAHTVRQFAAADLAAHYRAHWRPRNAVLVLAGGFDPDALAPEVERIFGSLADSGEPLPAPVAANGEAGPQRKLVFDSFGGGSGITLAMPVCGISAPDVVPLQAANYLLGGGLSSRLFMRLRERSGLAYDVGSSIAHFVDRGYLLAYAASTREHMVECCERLLAEVREFGQAGVTETEMRRMRRFVRCQTDFRCDDAADLAHYFGVRELLERPAQVHTPLDDAQEFDALTREDVNAVLRRWIRSDNAVVVCRSDGGWWQRRRLRRVLDASMNWARRGEGDAPVGATIVGGSAP